MTPFSVSPSINNRTFPGSGNCASGFQLVDDREKLRELFVICEDTGDFRIPAGRPAKGRLLLETSR